MLCGISRKEKNLKYCGWTVDSAKKLCEALLPIWSNVLGIELIIAKYLPSVRFGVVRVCKVYSELTG